MIISIDALHFPYIRIEFKIKDFEAGATLQLSRWRPGRYEASNYTKFIRSVTCRNLSGSDISLKKDNFHTWRPMLSDTSDIIVSYEYYANQLDAGGTYVDTDICYFNFLNFALYCPSRLSEPVEIQIDMPSGFTVATALEKTARGWTAEDFYQLADSPMLASARLTQLTYESHGIPFHIWFHQLPEAVSSGIAAHFKAFTDQQIEELGFFPEDSYHFLIITYPEKLYHGVEHGKSTVICLGPTDKILNEKYNDLLGISSHELFHAWNIILIRPREFRPYDYSNIVSFETGFVAEGFTTYLGDLFLVRSGVRDLSWYLTELGVLFRRHFENFGRRNTSLADSSRDLWVDGYQPAAPERKGSIYVEGAIFAMMLDLKIRLATNHSASITDLVKLMASRFSGEGYTTVDIRKLAESIYGQSLEQFFNEYLYSTKDTRPMLESLLGEFGLAIEEKHNARDIERIAGIRILESGEKWKIAKIHPDSPAARHLRVGDILESIEGSTEISEEMNLLHESLKLSISRHGIVHELNIDLVGKEFLPVYNVIITDQAGAFNSWMNLD